MSHIFDSKKFKKLESPERKKMLPVSEVLSFLPLEKDSVVADVGCGIGYFSIPFAGVSTEVFAIDISQIMIDELKKRVSKENIRVCLGDFSNFLDKNSIDIFFTATVIHEVDDLKDFSLKAIEVIKTGGYLVYLDFMKKEMSFGPDIDKRISESELIDLYKELGLTDIMSHHISDTFYIVKGKK